MEKLRRSWCIFQESMRLIGERKKLLIFPLISAAAMILLISLIIGGIGVLTVLMPEAAEQTAEPTEAAELCTAVAFLVFYLLTMLVSTFCNVAFFEEIFRGLEGEEVSIRRGIGFAFRRFTAVFLWSLFASTVGVILHMFQRRSGLLGAIAGKIAGVAWAVASCFAIPVLVSDTELNNPVEALRRSAATIRRTWGEALIGFLGIQSISALAVVLFFGFTAGMVALSVSCAVTMYLTLPLIAAAMIALILFCYLVHVAQQIYQAALFLYSQGEPVEGFDRAELECAFRSRY